MEMVEYIVSYGKLMFLALFLVALFFGVIFGLIRGMKRQLLRFVIIIICLVVALFITPVITKAILNTPVPALNEDGGSISDMINENLNFGDELFDQMNNYKSIIEQLPSMFFNVILFVPVFFLLKLLTLPIFAILKGVLFKKDREKQRKKNQSNIEISYQKPKTQADYYKIQSNRQSENDKPQNKLRLAGAGIGLLQGFVIALVIMIPFAAYFNAFSSIADEIDVAAIEANEDYEEYIEYINAAKDVSSIYKKSIPGAIYNGIKLDKLFYNYLTTIKAGGYSTNLEEVAILTGKGVGVFSEFSVNISKWQDGEVDPAVMEEQTIEMLIHLKDYLNNYLLDNGIVKALLNDLSEVYKNNKSAINFDEEIDDENLASAAKAIVENMTAGNFAENFKRNINELFEYIISIAEDGYYGDLVGMIEAEKDAFSSLDKQQAQKLGKVIDGFLDLSIIKASGDHLFNYFGQSLMEGMSELFGEDAPSLKLNLVKWEAAFGTFFDVSELMKKMDEDGENADLADSVVAIIESLEEQLDDYGNDISGIVALCDSAIRNMIVEAGIDGIDAAYMKNKTLDLIENKDEIGTLVELVTDKDLLDGLNTNIDTLSDEDMESIDRLSAHLDKLSNATGDLATIINDITSSMMGVENASNAIASLKKSMDAYKLVINAKDDVSQFTSDDAEELITLIEDDLVLEMIETNLQEEQIALAEEHKEVIQDKLDELRIEGDIDLEKLEKIAEILGLVW